MHTLSTRALSALAFDRDQEFDPGPPLSPGVLEDLELVVGARAIVTDISPADRQRRRERARRRRLAGDPGMVLGRRPDRRAVGDRPPRAGVSAMFTHLTARPTCAPRRTRVTASSCMDYWSCAAPPTGVSPWRSRVHCTARKPAADCYPARYRSRSSVAPPGW